MYKKSGIGLIAASLLLLAGCGGSDGGASLPVIDPNAPAALATTANADIVVGYVLARTSGIDLDPTGSLPRNTAPLSGEGSGLSSDLGRIGGIAKRYTDLARDSKPATSNPQAHYAVSYTLPCGISGTVTISYTYSDPSQDTVGDNFILSFASCSESTYDPDLMVYVNEMINGSLSATLTSIGADANTFSADYLYTNLSVTDLDSGDSATLNGGYSGDFSGDGYTTVQQTTLTGTSLTITGSTGGVVQTEILSNFSLASTASYNTNIYTRDYDFTVNSTEIGGSITVTTVTPFVVDLNVGPYPTAGQVVISAISGAKVRVTAQPDGTNVYIEYDIDPIDGTYETTATKTWSSL